MLRLLAFLASLASSTSILLAQERLEGSEIRGVERICVYTVLLPGAGMPRTNSRTVGIGEPCPHAAGAEPVVDVPAAPKVPMLARLIGQSDQAGRSYCIYAFGDRRYSAPLSPGRSCKLTPLGY